MRISAVIFDLDGLLSDTECLHMQAYQKVLKKYSVKLTDQEYKEHWIKNGLGISSYLKKHNLIIDYPNLRKEKAIIYNKLLKTSLKPMPYAIDIVKNLYKKKKLAIASSSYRENVETVLELLDIKKCMDVIVSGCDVENLKPHPEIFNLAVNKLNVIKEESIILEDAEKGVIAANNANIKVIAIPNKYTINNNFKTADYLVNSLMEAEKIILTM